jgi:hypothetical protein
MPFTYNPNDPNTKEFLAKIGEIIVSLNALENNVDFWIWELLSASGTPAEKQVIGRLVTSPLDFMGKVNLLRSLVVHRLGEEKDNDFRNAYNLLKQSAETRNDVAHSMWFIQYGSSPDDLSTEKINEIKAFQRGKKFDFTKAVATVKLTDFDKYLETIENAQRELFSFIHKHFLKIS